MTTDGAIIASISCDPGALRKTGIEEVKAGADHIAALQSHTGSRVRKRAGVIINGSVGYWLKLYAVFPVKDHIVNIVWKLWGGNTIQNNIPYGDLSFQRFSAAFRVNDPGQPI